MAICSKQCGHLTQQMHHGRTTSIGDQVFTYAEFQTIMFEAAQIVNQRPIGRKPSSPEGSYLSQNDLLLGRSTSHVPQGPFAKTSSVKQRMRFIQEIVNRFWKRWSQEVFPSKVIEAKWHTELRKPDFMTLHPWLKSKSQDMYSTTPLLPPNVVVQESTLNPFIILNH